jgi:hypothetical protein
MSLEFIESPNQARGNILLAELEAAGASFFTFIDGLLREKDDDVIAYEGITYLPMGLSYKNKIYDLIVTNNPTGTEDRMTVLFQEVLANDTRGEAIKYKMGKDGLVIRLGFINISENLMPQDFQPSEETEKPKHEKAEHVGWLALSKGQFEDVDSMQPVGQEEIRAIIRIIDQAEPKIRQT